MTSQTVAQAGALLDALLSNVGDTEGVPRAQSNDSRPPPATDGRPTLLGWNLDVPRGRPCLYNLVTLYKHRGFVTNANDQSNGWEACKRLEQLKGAISHGGAATALETLVEYAALLTEARQHAATNESAFIYDHPVAVSSYELDFELYMTFSHLAARDVLRAQQARRLDTREALGSAAALYERAAWFLTKAHSELYARLPPPERARQHAEVDWIMQLVPLGLSRAAAGEMVRVRAELLRAEAALCHRRALERELANDEFADLRDMLLDGTAEYCARLFLSITRTLSAFDGGKSRIARYAAFTACRLQSEVAARIAESDIKIADRDKDALALARAIRRVEYSVLPKCTLEQRGAVGEDVAQAMDRVQMETSALRQRADSMRYESTGIFSMLDLTSSMTHPSTPTPVNPAAPDGSEPPPPEANPEIAAVESMRIAFSVQHQRFTAFFALRTAHAQALQQMQRTTHPSSVSAVPSGFTDFDVLFQNVLQQIGTLPASRRAQMASDQDMWVEMMRVMHDLGALGERERWLDFMFATDDGNNPDATIVRHVEQMNATKLHVSRYLALLSEGTGATHPA